MSAAGGRTTALHEPTGERIERTTPEGIPVRFQIATGGDRVGAFLVDFVLMMLSLLALGLLVQLAGGGAWLQALLMLLAFVVQHGYFIWFELRWQGATPGKRRLGLRVIDGRGGALGADAVVVRNLTRTLEFFLPLGVVLAPEAIWPGSPPWVRGVASLWVLIVALLPLFNRHRLRVGDLLGGTLVVVAPKTVLLADQGAVRAPKAAATFTFTDAQLDVYGIYELQVLEELLRHSDGRDAHQKLGAVYRKIRAKIGNPPLKGVVVEPERYLRDFYAALRARLEGRMLLGKRKADKHG